MTIRTRIVFIAGAEPRFTGRLDQRQQHLQDGQFYVAEVGLTRGERVVAGPFSTAEDAEDARLLEERIDLAAAELFNDETPGREYPMFRMGFRDGWNGREIASINSPSAYEHGHRCGCTERKAFDGGPRFGLTDRARFGHRPRLQQAVDTYLGSNDVRH